MRGERSIDCIGAGRAKTTGFSIPANHFERAVCVPARSTALFCDIERLFAIKMLKRYMRGSGRGRRASHRASPAAPRYRNPARNETSKTLDAPTATTFCSPVFRTIKIVKLLCTCLLSFYSAFEFQFRNTRADAAAHTETLFSVQMENIDAYELFLSPTIETVAHRRNFNDVDAVSMGKWKSSLI